MRRLLLGLTLLLVATLAWWLWPPAARQTPEMSPLAGPDSTATPAHPPPASPAGTDRANVASYTPPPTNPELTALEDRLPPVSTPLAQAREAWWSAARQGSGEAAWRLVVASETCLQYAAVRKLVLRQRGKPEDASRVAMEEFLVLGESYCAGLDGDQEVALREAMQLGVQAGDVRALASYVFNPPLPRQLGIRLADELVRYRSQAPAIAQRLFNQGYREMPGHLARAHDGRSPAGVRIEPRPQARSEGFDSFALPPPQRVQPALGQVLPDDPALAWRYARLCAKVGSGYDREQCRIIERAHEALLDDAQKAALQAWVDAQVKRGFRKSLPSGAGLALRVYSL